MATVIVAAEDDHSDTPDSCISPKVIFGGCCIAPVLRWCTFPAMRTMSAAIIVTISPMVSVSASLMTLPRKCAESVRRLLLPRFATQLVGTMLDKRGRNETGHGALQTNCGSMSDSRTWSGQRSVGRVIERVQ